MTAAHPLASDVQKNYAPIWALVPVKLWRHSKTRLSPLLGEAQRAQLSEAMLRDLLESLRNSQCLQHTLLVGSTRELAQIAADFEVQILDEGSAAGLNNAVKKGYNYARMQGAATVCVVHADLPYLSAAALDKLLAGHLVTNSQLQKADRISLVTDLDAIGTNIMVLDTELEFNFQYGENSRSKHEQQAQGLNCPIETLSLANLSDDIDKPQDLYRLRSNIREAQLMDKPYPHYSANFLDQYTLDPNEQV